MTTRRHYDAVATILSEALTFSDSLKVLGVISHNEKIERDLAIAGIKIALADYYASANPNFDRRRFDDTAYKLYKERALQ